MVPFSKSVCSVLGMVLCSLIVTQARSEEQWELLHKQGDGPYGTDSYPSVRYSHAAVSWRNEMITTHGYFYDRNTGKPTWLDDTWGFSLVPPYEWRQIVPLGGHNRNGSGVDVPFGRYAHAVAVVGDHLYLQGGTDGGERIHGEKGFKMKMEFDDFWRLNLMTDQWEKIPFPKDKGPGKRYLHQAVGIANRFVFMFGGSNSSSMFRWDTVSHRWAQLVPYPGAPWPSHRQGHAMVALPETSTDHGFLLFGGTSWGSESKALLNDVWVYSVNNKKWTEIEPAYSYGMSEQIPAPRLYHHMGEFEDGRVALMGGSINTPGMKCQSDTWLYSAHHNEWIQLADAPLEIYHHTVVTHSDTNSMFIFGGHACGADSPEHPAYQNSVWKLVVPKIDVFEHEEL